MWGSSKRDEKTEVDAYDTSFSAAGGSSTREPVREGYTPKFAEPRRQPVMPSSYGQPAFDHLDDNAKIVI